MNRVTINSYYDDNAAVDVDIPAPATVFLNQWNCIPVVCRLSATDSKTLLELSARRDWTSFSVKPDRDRSPPTLECSYVVPRQSYLFLHLETIFESFTDLAANREGSLWLSYTTPHGTFIPLMWQYPVTVAIDMLRSRIAEESKVSDINMYPLRLTAHFSEPSREFLAEYHRILKIKNLNSKMIFLKQVIKRSLMYAYSTTLPLIQLEAEHADYYVDFFEGIQENNPHQFFQGRCVLRFYGELSDEASAITPDSDGDVNLFEPRLLEKSTLPVMLHSHGTSKLVRWQPNGQRLGQFLREHVPWLEFLTREDIFNRQEPPNFVTIQGISPLLSSPLDELYELLSCVDLCLHIVVQPMFVTKRLAEDMKTRSYR